MNYAIVLAGGTGTRLGTDIPKQYVEVNGKPIIAYCLEKLQNNNNIDKIVIVASPIWQEYITNQIKLRGITKFSVYADGGKSRQHSVLNALKVIKENNDCKGRDYVLIHDSARPNLSDEIIDACANALLTHDGAMPVLNVTDTIYYSENGCDIHSLPDRDKLYAGQAPESFNFDLYYDINIKLTDEELSMVRGSSQIAFVHGMKIKLVPGDSKNYKITTMQDLDRFESEIYKKELK